MELRPKDKKNIGIYMPSNVPASVLNISEIFLIRFDVNSVLKILYNNTRYSNGQSQRVNCVSSTKLQVRN